MLASLPSLAPTPAVARGWVSLGELPSRLGASLVEVVRALESQGLADMAGRPTSHALREEAARWMERSRQYHWRCERVAQALNPSARKSSGVDLPTNHIPRGFGSMTRAGEPFQRSAVMVGQQLKRMGWRDEQGNPSAHALSKGLAHMQVSAHGRVNVQWHLARTRRALAEAGWEPVARPALTKRSGTGRPAYVGKPKAIF